MPNNGIDHLLHLHHQPISVTAEEQAHLIAVQGIGYLVQLAETRPATVSHKVRLFIGRPRRRPRIRQPCRQADGRVLAADTCNRRHKARNLNGSGNKIETQPGHTHAVPHHSGHPIHSLNIAMPARNIPNSRPHLPQGFRPQSFTHRRIYTVRTQQAVGIGHRRPMGQIMDNIVQAVINNRQIQQNRPVFHFCRTVFHITAARRSRHLGRAPIRFGLTCRRLLLRRHRTFRIIPDGVIPAAQLDFLTVRRPDRHRRCLHPFRFRPRRPPLQLGHFGAHTFKQIPYRLHRMPFVGSQIRQSRPHSIDVQIAPHLKTTGKQTLQITLIARVQGHGEQLLPGKPTYARILLLTPLLFQCLLQRLHHRRQLRRHLGHPCCLRIARLIDGADKVLPHRPGILAAV